MTPLRSQLFPHLAYAVTLALFVVVAIARISGHSATVAAIELRLDSVSAALGRMDELHILTTQVNHAARSHLETADPQDHALIDALDLQRRTIATMGEQVPMLAASMSFSAMTSVGRDIERAAKANGGTLTDDSRMQIAAGADELRALWSNLNAEIAARQIEVAEDLRAASRALFLEASLALLTLVVLAVTYAVAVNLTLTRPLRSLAAVARQVTSGDLTARAPPRGTAQVTALTDDFNEMVAILVQSLHEEEQVVRQLRRKTRELEEANRHKSHFLANVSHELKTPLNAIIGFADILSAEHHGTLNQRQLDYMKRIFAAGQHLLAMISDLIDIAKLDLGSMSLKVAEVDVTPTIRDLVDMLGPQIQEKHHHVACQLPEEGIVIETDPRRFRQIILNLLSNAIKFTPAEGEIRIGARRDAGRVCISVADNGVGIARADRERIFEDFVQLDSVLHRRHEGTGIGLPLSRRLAVLMHGEISLESQPGEGSTFEVTLPLRADRPPPAPPSPQAP